MDKYEMITRLGGGSFADVYKAREKSTGKLMAIKVLKKKYNKWEDCLDLREVKSLKKLHEDHLVYQKGFNHIITLHEIIFIKETGTLNLVFEYMEKDLYELMKSCSPKKLSENQIRSIVYQTLEGMAFMHKYGFFHRDMKPENLLVTGETIKIADFGLAREIRSVPPYTEYVSTRYYRAPECILKSTNYNSPVDIWALGCIMAEMYLHPQPLFFGNNEKEVLFRICSILGAPTQSTWPEGKQQAEKVDIKFPNMPGTNLAQVIPHASADAIDLMYRMINWDPIKRATAHNLLQHPFFINYEILERISLPEYETNNTGSTSGIKRYSNNKNKNSLNKIADSKGSKRGDDNLSKMLNDTAGFDKLINQLQKEKIEEEKELSKKKNFNNGNRDRDFECLNEPKKEKQNMNKKIQQNKQSKPPSEFYYSQNYEIPSQLPMFNSRQNQPEKPPSSPKKKSNSPKKVSGLNSMGNTNNNPIQIKSTLSNSNDPFGGDSFLNQFNNKQIDFDTDVILKKESNTNNSRKRSARRFMEETNNDVNFKNEQPHTRVNDNTSNINPLFQFNNQEFTQNINRSVPPVIMKSDFPSRRAQQNSNYRVGKVSENNNMMIGDSPSQKKNFSNFVLFGMESRRGHNNMNVQQKDWEI